MKTYRFAILSLLVAFCACTIATLSAKESAPHICKAYPLFGIGPTPSVKIRKSDTELKTIIIDITFLINIRAAGGDIYFGNQAETGTFRARVAGTNIDTAELDKYSDWSELEDNVIKTIWPVPSMEGVITANQKKYVAFVLKKDTEITIPVTFTWEYAEADNPRINVYAANIQTITWSPDGVHFFVDSTQNQCEWNVIMPQLRTGSLVPPQDEKKQPSRPF